MRAIQITEFGRPEDVVRVVDVPEPPSPGPFEVKVAVELSPLNKHDLLLVSGALLQPPLPLVLGNEGVARVVEAGQGVGTVAVGDLVVVPLFAGAWRERLVLPALIIATIWHRVPLNIIFYLAALQTVPRSLYEAAEIDGANRWQQFRHITWPLVTPTTFFVLIITTISLLIGAFDLVNVMTSGQGGPLDASNVFVFNIYRTAFTYFQMGYASAMAYILFLVVLAFTAIQWWLQKRWVHY